MRPERTCPDCGATLPADAPRGLCPNCLMGAALSRTSPPLHEATGAFEPAGPGVLATIAQSIGPVPRLLLHDTAPGETPGPIVRPDGDDADPSIRYRIDGEIARGGMGAVLRGRDPDLGRDVAIKVLRADLRDNADLVRRFVEEAQIGGQLQHPGRGADLRAGHLRRPPAVLQHEAGERPDARRPARGPLRPGRRPATVPVDLRGHGADDGLLAHPRRDPSRPQALQRDGRQLRRGPGDGLGPGTGPAARRGRRRCEGGEGAAPGDPDHDGGERLGPGPLPRRLDHGHAELHAPRAGAGPDRSDRRAGRRLRPGLDPLRGPHREAGVHGLCRDRDPPQGGRRRHRRRGGAAGGLWLRGRADRAGEGLPGGRARGPAARRQGRGRADHGLPGGGAGRGSKRPNASGRWPWRGPRKR